MVELVVSLQGPWGKKGWWGWFTEWALMCGRRREEILHSAVTSAQWTECQQAHTHFIWSEKNPRFMWKTHTHTQTNTHSLSNLKTDPLSFQARIQGNMWYQVISKVWLYFKRFWDNLLLLVHFALESHNAILDNSFSFFTCCIRGSLDSMWMVLFSLKQLHSALLWLCIYSKDSEG